MKNQEKRENQKSSVISEEKGDKEKSSEKCSQKGEVLDTFENPYGPPRPTESQNPPATKKEIPKNPKTPIIPKSKPRLSPKVNARSPKVNARSLKVNVKYLGNF